jgi:hypothetical protein
MTRHEMTELDLVLIVDESGSILKGKFRDKALSKGLIHGRVSITIPPSKEEPEKYCKIVNGQFCCKPKVAGVPL